MTTVTPDQTPPERGGGPLGMLRRANKKLLFVIAVVIIAIAVLMATSLRGTLTYYRTVDELTALGPAGYGERMRVGGRVVAGSIQRDAANNLSFAIYHDAPVKALPVQYKGIVPDIFGDERDVIVEGQWKPDGTFYATNLLAQHPPEFKVAATGTPHAPVKR